MTQAVFYGQLLPLLYSSFLRGVITYCQLAQWSSTCSTFVVCRTPKYWQHPTSFTWIKLPMTKALMVIGIPINNPFWRIVSLRVLSGVVDAEGGSARKEFPIRYTIDTNTRQV